MGARTPKATRSLIREHHMDVGSSARSATGWLEKPLPQWGPGQVAAFLGGTVAVVLILAVALAVLLLHRRQQKSWLETDGGGTALPSSQNLEPPPDRQSYLAPEDIQILHLEPGKRQQLQQEREEQEQLPLQAPYCDLGTAPHHPSDSGLKDTDVHYAELDISTLEVMSESRTTVPGPGEVVEYATIQLSPPQHMTPSHPALPLDYRPPGLKGLKRLQGTFIFPTNTSLLKSPPPIQDL
ncbi:uncharacterized protein LOC115943075 [Leptonychotes weddellii]|uniref:Uncharacterized protein LOC115943075 n=1 Tax=Leptonychotes weddellii TaxID=9713 RepID=A0A7F8RC61_LEPWE|nr:uncharacterized protein LOC115943075 [Leptonychotes weddellii]